MYVNGNPISFNDPDGHWPHISNLFHKLADKIWKKEYKEFVNKITDPHTYKKIWNDAGKWCDKQQNKAEDWYNKQWDKAKSWFDDHWFALIIITLIMIEPVLFFVLIELATVKFRKEGSDWGDLKDPYHNFIKADWMGAKEWKEFLNQRGDHYKEFTNQALHLTMGLLLNTIVPGGGLMFGVALECKQHNDWDWPWLPGNKDQMDHGEDEPYDRGRDIFFWSL